MNIQEFASGGVLFHGKNGGTLRPIGEDSQSFCYRGCLWMLVVKGFEEKPLMVLTTEPLRQSKKVLKNILLSYIKRWSIEETIRFVKQTYDLENIRVLRYVCLKNVMAIVLIVFYFLAVVLDMNQKLKLLTGHVFEAAKRVFGIPDFGYYTLGDGISAIFKRNPGKIVLKNQETTWYVPDGVKIYLIFRRKS